MGGFFNLFLNFQTEGKDGFILVHTFEPFPKICFLTVLREYARGLQLIHYSHKQLCNKGPVLQTHLNPNDR